MKNQIEAFITQLPPEYHEFERILIALRNKYEDVKEEKERFKGLLKIAQCPNCDGSGGIPHQVSSRQYVTRDMAIDAGDESLEGSLYSGDEWELEPCRWCYERDQAIKES